jgi:hypothetical protein
MTVWSVRTIGSLGAAQLTLRHQLANIINCAASFHLTKIMWLSLAILEAGSASL